LLVAAAIGAALVAWARPGSHRAEARVLATLPRPAIGDTPGRAASAAEDNAACEGCHAEIAEEWRGSMHRAAYRDGAFQRALAVEPLAFCRGCHAPEAPTDAAPSPELAEMGVGCITCHRAGDEVLAAPDARGASGAPHGLLRSAAFGGPQACASCHEFAFPGAAPGGGAERMQTTVREHASSAHAETACASCHMPEVPSGVGEGGGEGGERGARHRSHAFGSSRTEGAQARAIEVEARRQGDTVHVELRAPGVGHAFPTGDLFRRMVVRAEVVGEEGRLLAERQRYIARHWGRERDVAHRVLVADDRPNAPALAGRPARVTLEMGAEARGYPVRVSVTYQRIAHPAEGRPGDAVVESEALVAERWLPAAEVAQAQPDARAGTEARETKR
jgi:hypothetical protein